MHPRQQYAPLKPQIGLLNRNNRFGKGVLAAWLCSERSGAHGVEKNGAKNVYDYGPYGCDAVSSSTAPDEFKTVVSPYGPAIFFDSPYRGVFRKDFGKFWNGLESVSVAAAVHRRAASTKDTIIGVGFGSTTEKFVLDFGTDNKIRVGARATSGGLQYVKTDNTFASTSDWYFVVGTVKLESGGGEHHIFVNGIDKPVSGTLNHSADAFDGTYGSTDCTLGGIDYPMTTWSIWDMAFCYVWAWELQEADAVALMQDPYQMFYRPESSRYADIILEEDPMPHYMITLPTKQGQTIISGDRTLIVEAATSEIARDFAEARKAGDTASWDDATVTLVEDSTDEYAGSIWRIKISGKPVPSPDRVDVSYTAQSGDGIDEIGNGLAAALRAPGGLIPTAAYSGGTLTIAGAAENLGDRSVTVEITPSDATLPIPNRTGGPVGDITHEGVQGAALLVELSDAGLPQLKASG